MGLESVLLVQCCHPPHFFFVAQRLRQRHPEWQIEALVLDHPLVHEALQRFPWFSSVHVLGATDLSESQENRHLIFPLLTPGYRSIKRFALELEGQRWQTDFQGNLSPLPYLSPAWSGLARAYPSPPAAFMEFLEVFPVQPIQGTAFLVESCHSSLIAATERRWRRYVPKESNLVRLPASEPPSQAWSRLRSARPGGAIVFSSGETGFGFRKWLPFLARVPRIVVYNEFGDEFEARPRQLASFWLRRLRRGSRAPRPRPRIVLFQTTDAERLIRAGRQIRAPELYFDSRLLVVSHQEDLDHLRREKTFDEVFALPDGSLRSLIDLYRKLHSFDPDLVAATFSGTSGFRLQKVLFLLSNVRRHLVFNRHLEAYSLTPRTLSRLLSRRRLLSVETESTRESRRVLVIQTEDDQKVLRALEVIGDPNVVLDPHIVVFCREDRRSVFEAHPKVREVVTYLPGRPWTTLGRIWRLGRIRFHVISAVFSGRPIFRKQKLAAFLVFSAQSRLIFNEHLDCFYLDSRTLMRFLAARGRHRFSQVPIIRLLLKAILFLPRFAYLLIWYAYRRLRRRRRLSGAGPGHCSDPGDGGHSTDSSCPSPTARNRLANRHHRR